MSYGDSKIGTPWRGYYITAYGIAVKHGFKGTEEEWLASLQGVDGRSIEIRYNDVTNVLEWKFTDDDAWTQLLDLEQLQTEIVAQTLAQAQAAQQAAEAAQAAAEAAQQEAERNAGVTQADASITQTNVQLSQDAKAAAQAAQVAAGTAQQAAEAAQAAAETAETGAEESATLSKSWAVGGTGTRPGEDTNNAEYWAGQAAAAAGGGVISFNGRTGTVLPQDGDYDADKVGAANKELNNLDAPQLALVNLGARPNKNLLDNWYFVGGGGPGQFPVNQRGRMSYTGMYVYGIDRWKLAGTVTLESDGISIQQGATVFFMQLLPNEILNAIRGKTITISVAYVNGGLKIACTTFIVAQQGGIDGPEIVIGDVLCDLHKYGEDAAQIRFFAIDAGNSIKLAAVKLELGPTQTLAHQEGGKWVLNEIPNYAEQLARCQRYFRRFPDRYMLGGFQSSTVAVFRYPCDPPMRTTPVITLQNASDLTDALDDGKTPVTPSSVVLNWASKPESIGFYFSGASPNTCCVCDRYVDASADL